MIDDLIEWTSKLIDEAREEQTKHGELSERRLPVSVWAGFADLGRGRGHDVLEMLAEAGVGRVIFTPTNDAASSSFDWQPRRSQLVRGIRAAKALSLEVWLGPWVRCDKQFLTETGMQLRELAEEVGGVDGWELDAEGSWEVTARNRGKSHKRGVKGAVSECLPYLTQHMTPEEHLSATVLYFNRPAGDALLREERVTAATIQAYSIWLQGQSAKASSTHKSGFQPGTLQEKAWSNYWRFKRERQLHTLEMGLGWWAQDRRKAPPSMQLSKAAAFRKASDACLRLGADGVCGWAVHLWDSPTKKGEREYLDLVLDEVRYLSQTQRVNHEATSTRPTSPDGSVIDWDGRWTDPKVAEGGRPDGWRAVRGLGLDARLFGKVAKVIRQEALDSGWPRGSCVPYTQQGRQMVGVFQRHTATWQGGRIVKGLYEGLTIFTKEV